MVSGCWCNSTLRQRTNHPLCHMAERRFLRAGVAAVVLLAVGSSSPHAHDSGTGRVPLRPLALRGGSWLFTPKIVPVSEGDGGVVQWRQQPVAPCDAAASGGGVPEHAADGGPAVAPQGAPEDARGAGARGRVRAAAGGVQRTNDDSTASKASASRAGYFQDEFIESFVGAVPARTALINRGYFTRVQAVRSVIAAFLDACNSRGQPCQILSLGAGFDTAYWVMKRQQKLDTCTWVEVDFPDTVCPHVCALAACPCGRVYIDRCRCRLHLSIYTRPHSTCMCTCTHTYIMNTHARAHAHLTCTCMHTHVL